MTKLDIEETKDYKEAEVTKKYLKILAHYYDSDKNFDELEMEDISIRELFRFMSDNNFPKKGFVSKEDREKFIERINEEIDAIQSTLKKLRLAEMEERKLNSIIILPSWSSIIGYQTKGFYLNRPVLELKKDAIIMLSHEILNVKDKYDNEFALITGPGIFFTEFSIAPGSYVTDTKEINALLLPVSELRKLLSASPIFDSDIQATMNELISIIPFNLIEEVNTKRALLRGVISRNIFHPQKAVFHEFFKLMDDPKSANPNNGFKILSAHERFFNRLLLTEEPEASKGDASLNLTSAGIASILTNGQKLLDEMLSNKEQGEILLSLKDIKQQFNEMGKSILNKMIN